MMIWKFICYFIQRLKCCIHIPMLYLGCRYFVLEERLSEQVDKIRCRTCGKYYLIHHGLRAVIKWDKDFEKFYHELKEPYFTRGYCRKETKNE